MKIMQNAERSVHYACMNKTNTSCRPALKYFV